MGTKVFDTPLHIVLDTIGYSAFIAFAIFFGMAAWQLRGGLRWIKPEYRKEATSISALLAGFPGIGAERWYFEQFRAARTRALRYMRFALASFGVGLLWVLMRLILEVTLEAS